MSLKRSLRQYIVQLCKLYVYVGISLPTSLIIHILRQDMLIGLRYWRAIELEVLVGVVVLPINELVSCESCFYISYSVLNVPVALDNRSQRYLFRSGICHFYTNP
jgi:hypothetical protein